MAQAGAARPRLSRPGRRLPEARASCRQEGEAALPRALPTGAPPPPPAAAPVRAGPGAQPVRVFVVEDDALSAIVLNDLLGLWGYAVCGMADTASAAIAEVERLRPDLLLMDIRLAGNVDGIEAAQEIRRRLGIRPIFITAHTDRATIARIHQAEPLGFLPKPYMPEQLRLLLAEVLGRLRSG